MFYKLCVAFFILQFFSCFNSYAQNKTINCTIDHVLIENSQNNILNFINSPIDAGSSCDLQIIQNKLTQLKNNYWRQGYLSADVKIKDIVYLTPNKDRAILNLIIEKGLRTIVQIRDEKNALLTNNFLNLQQNYLVYSDLIFLSNSELNSRLEKYYKNLGYPNVSIINFRKINKKKEIILEFTVSKLQRVKIAEVCFDAILPENKEQILQSIGLKRGFFNEDIYFSEDKLLEYTDAVKAILLKYGYLDVQVSIPDFTFSADGEKVNLNFHINLGKKYIISSIKRDNLPANVNSQYSNLKNIITIGSPVNIENIQKYIEELRAKLINSGYLYAKVNFKTHRANVLPVKEDKNINFIELIIDINAGDIIKIANIDVKGDDLGKEREIIAISGLERGAIFTRQKMDMAIDKILRHQDLFSSVIIEYPNLEVNKQQLKTIDIVIRVRAKNAYLLSFSPGWGNLKGYRFSTEYSLYNIKHSGVHLITNLGLSQERHQTNFATIETSQILGEQLNLGLAEPLFRLGSWNTPFDVALIAGYQQMAETLTNRKYQTLKLSIDWKSFLLGHNFSLNSLLMHERSASTSAQSAVVETIDSPALVIHEWFNTLTLDNRNHSSWPTSGELFSVGLGMARFGIGSDISYNRLAAKAHIYFPISEKLSGAILTGANFIFDTINDNGLTVTPPASRRSALTDDALIRGFSENYGAAVPGPLLWVHYSAQSQSAYCNTELASLGATNLLYFKAESRYRLNSIFGLVAFVDSGESYFSAKEIAQINAQIKKQINPNLTGACIVDQASLIAASTPDFQNFNFLEQYWRAAYISTGLGLRAIFGNFATLSLDYGYPLKEPNIENMQQCISPAEALNADTPPSCISRVQNSTIGIGNFNLQFKGAFHLGVGAQF